MMTMYLSGFPLAKTLRLGIALGTVSTLATALAQGADGGNAQAVDAWQAKAGGGPVPTLVPTESGTSRLEWTAGVTADSYEVKVETVNPALTAMQAGDYYRLQTQGDFRMKTTADAQAHFQFATTHANDVAVMNRPRQINNLQAGVTASQYQFAFGDVAPNFSSLGSALAARGGLGSYRFGDLSLQAYLGTVAESWEALEGGVLRNQFLRDTKGIKAEYAWSQALKLYATRQTGADREGSVTNPDLIAVLNPARISSRSAGFQFQEGNLSLSGEAARGWQQVRGQEGMAGGAELLDGAWRNDSLSLRGGWHRIDPRYASLSAMVQSGITEAYGAGDWTAASWLTLGIETRDSRSVPLLATNTLGTATRTLSDGLRLNFSFGENLPGLGLALSRNDARTRDPLGFLTRNLQTAGSFNYNRPGLSTSLGYGITNTRSAAAPTSDSDAETWQVGITRNFDDANDATPATWGIDVGFNGAHRTQHMAGNVDVRDVSYALSLNARRNGWGTLSLNLTQGLLTQAFGQPDLHQRGVQLEASRPLAEKSSLKLYYRDLRRNIGVLALAVREHVAGLQLTYQF